MTCQPSFPEELSLELPELIEQCVNGTATAQEAARLDRLMIETDAPYLSPEPMRKQKVNEPALLIHTAKFVAALRGMELAKFIEAVTATATHFFSLPYPT